MVVSRVKSVILNGLDVTLTEVEVGFSRGIPGITVVGLPDNAVKESRERIRFAIKNAGFEFPTAQKIVVNLVPADIRKEGTALDLPIAVGILHNRNDLKHRRLDDLLFYGELNLKGELKPVRGILNLTVFARNRGYRGVVIPHQNVREATHVKGVAIYGMTHLRQVIEFLVNRGTIRPATPLAHYRRPSADVDLGDIRGQFLAKRVLEIAAAGGHNLLMVGPPGSGKSMLAKALPSILPDMETEEILETSMIYSAAGLLNDACPIVSIRPFRSPHHTISDVGISGGGRSPVPGEISLAHNGVLFLDELPHFKKSALEVLRQPLEDGKITISRSLTSHTFPAKFMLVAAMNPYGDSSLYGHGENHPYSDYQRRRYYGKISRPLLDRIDLLIEMKRVPVQEITAPHNSEASSRVKRRVSHARQRQLARFSDLPRSLFANAFMSNREIEKHCKPLVPAEQVLKRAVQKLDLSARSYFKVLKVARTIADLCASQDIGEAHVREALRYRSLDLLSR